MNEGIRNFIGGSISQFGELRLRNYIDVMPNDQVYMLIKTDCIEIRTKEQYDSLLKKLSKLITLTGDDKYKKIYTNIFSYSKLLVVNNVGEIRLGKNIVINRGFDRKVIIEKCDGCIKIWHPKMFKEELNESNRKR